MSEKNIISTSKYAQKFENVTIGLYYNMIETKFLCHSMIKKSVNHSYGFKFQIVIKYSISRFKKKIQLGVQTNLDKLHSLIGLKFK